VSEPNLPVLGIGIVGLGGAALGMIPAMDRSKLFRIAAAADLDPEILGRFSADYPDAGTYRDVAALCADPAVDLVYIGTPNRLHAEHACIAFEHRKHVLIEKPMAVSLEEADKMIALAERNGVLLGVNVKHSFEPRIRKIREFAVKGTYGQLRMINCWRFGDWLYRPRTAAELTPQWGGGIVWRQAPHQVDILRTIGGGLMRSLRAAAGAWDPVRRVAGAYSMWFEFEDGVSGTAVFSGYDHFDSKSLVHGFEGKRQLSDPKRHARARRELLSQANDPLWEEAAATAERYGGGRRSSGPKTDATPSGGWVLGGPLVASFDRADIRLSPQGLMVDGDTTQEEIAMPPGVDGPTNRLHTFHDSIVNRRPLPADGRWGKATQEVLIAIEESTTRRSEIALRHQVASVDAR
jgi:phthalate 4,5-cis-dihydrodiol dehydrogenase